LKQQQEAATAAAAAEALAAAEAPAALPQRLKTQLQRQQEFTRSGKLYAKLVKVMPPAKKNANAL